MKLLSGILGLTLTSVAAFASASAADMYVTGPGGYKDGFYVPGWAGFYAGVNSGYGWSADGNLGCPNTFGGCASSPISGVNPEGGFAGGQIGYNWQGWAHPNLVIGIETDIQGGELSDSKLDSNHNVFSSKLDWFGSVRGRLGYAFDRTLIYATGGFAYGGIHNEANYNFHSTVNNVAIIDRTATGYVLGGGLEYKFTPAWSVKAEYQYVNLGKNDPLFEPPFTGFTYTSLGGKVNDDAFHTLRAGLNYHFGAGYEPLK